MKIDILSVVIFIFCLGVGITLVDMGALVSYAEAAVDSSSSAETTVAAE